MKTEYIGFCTAGGVAVACIGMDGDKEISIFLDRKSGSVLQTDEVIIWSAVVDLDLWCQFVDLSPHFLGHRKDDIFLVGDFALCSAVVSPMTGIDNHDKPSLLVPRKERGRSEKGQEQDRNEGAGG